MGKEFELWIIDTFSDKPLQKVKTYSNWNEALADAGHICIMVQSVPFFMTTSVFLASEEESPYAMKTCVRLYGRNKRLGTIITNVVMMEQGEAGPFPKKMEKSSPNGELFLMPIIDE